MSNPTSVQTWASFLDFDETWQYLQMDNAPSGPQQLRLQRFIDSACSVAQGAGGANRPIAPTRFQERHDGWSGEYILLHHSPFLELVSCTEWQSSGGPISLPESTPSNPVEGIQIDYASSRIMRVFAGYSWPRPFFPGSRNIEVTYVAGFDPVPPDIWEATMELVAWKWRNTQESPRWFGQSAQFDGGADGARDPLYPGVPNRIAEVFESYRQITIG